MFRRPLSMDARAQAQAENQSTDAIDDTSMA